MSVRGSGGGGGGARARARVCVGVWVGVGVRGGRGRGRREGHYAHAVLHESPPRHRATVAPHVDRRLCDPINRAPVRDPVLEQRWNHKHCARHYHVTEHPREQPNDQALHHGHGAVATSSVGLSCCDDFPVREQSEEKGKRAGGGEEGMCKDDVSEAILRVLR
jgi:hypothetical protein